MKKNLIRKINMGILATFLGIGIGYCDSVWAWGETHNEPWIDSFGTYYGKYSDEADKILENGNITVNDRDNYNGVIGGYSYANRGTNDACTNIVTVNGGSIINNNNIGINTKHPLAIAGGYSRMKANNNTVTINEGLITGDIFGGYSTGKKGEAIGNTVNINGGEIIGDIYGAYKNSTGNITNNVVNISGGKIEGTVYAGALESSGDFKNNGITVTGGNLKNTDLAGFDVNLQNGSENIYLTINNFTGEIKSIKNFNNINFQNLNWQNGGTVLKIGNADNSSLANTNINLISIAGGQEINAGDYMYIIKSYGMLDTDKDKITVEQNFTAGVTINGTGEVIADDNGNIKFEVTGTSVNDQINLVAENRAVAAAFVNQGTDLINDSLDVLSRDGNYGIKTFAAVHGNRSKYDVNSDLKINGWSSIVGVGSEKNIGNGDFSWGVFYENGSGNYRTYNEFNNEFFRGDGSLVYNGGGIAARFEQDNGVYTEGSLRAGMLKSEMTDALKDGAGNSYGYKSESTYCGAHIGVGKIISLNEATDLDVYGKFFHTYTDGDSFEVAGDKFEFDSITSDRLRIGARLTTNKENKFSTYYGLAYEYEFNGDADMRAQNMSAPEQSLQGSSYLAEIGMNYKPGNESPWSFDLNMRGYAGQREGASFNLQANYSF